MEEDVGIPLPIYPGAIEVEHIPVRADEPVKCQDCGACCVYVAMEIDAPASVRAASDILWYLYHEHTQIRNESGEWSLEFRTRCRHLGGLVGCQASCKVYANRPQICRDHSEKRCEVNGEGSEAVTFTDAAQFIAWVRKQRPALFKRLKAKSLIPPQLL